MNSQKFSQIVEAIKKRLEFMYQTKTDPRFSRKTSPTEFEKLVVDASEIVLKEMEISCHIDYTEGGHAFPDIVYNFGGNNLFGIEVKSSTQANASNTSWSILGNSILGTTRVNVLDLHIIFIKVGDNGCFINSARYEDAVSDVAVTHSPRYKLDLNQNPEDSFFSRSGISYDDMKNSENPIGLVTDYFKNQGLTAWWIAESTPAVIKNWNELKTYEKNEILAKSLILFPEIIYSKSSDKYKNLSKWLVANYSVVDSSLRDKFTAGGRVNLNFNDKTFKNLPRIFATLKDLSKLFMHELKNVSIKELQQYWPAYNPQNDTFKDRIYFWKKIVSEGFANNDYKEKYINCINHILPEVNWP
ncbi:hypothetical protein [Eremococcus coleocola]|uniref:hypothetical protein n=1 Tax=Eremococcus coleocola TaxID=88132 RepID=UPI000423FBB8|nr:hypothetical protein [Eremococcus coleocola]